MTPTISLIVYSVLILLASLAGGWVPFVLKLTHKRLELAISFVAGAMLGVGLLHMVPHAFLARVEAGRAHATAALDHVDAHALLDPIVLWILIGFLAMFFIERFFCYHHHDVPSAAGGDSAATHRHEHGGSHAHDHQHGHGHVCAHSVQTPGHSKHRHRLTWAGAAVGLSLHSLIEGVALAASVEVGRQHGDGAALVGFGTFLAIFLHKPFDSLTLGALMSIGGRSGRARHLVNAAFSLLIPVGVFLFHLGVGIGDSGRLVSNALAFSAGTFLCIAMSDLLPELQFHQHDRGKLSASLLAGLALAWVLAVTEARMHGHGHQHDHVHDAGPAGPDQHDHDHDHEHDHDHDHEH